MAIGSQDLQFKVIASVVGQQAIDGLSGSLKNLTSSAQGVNKGLGMLATAGKAFVGALAANEVVQFGKSLIDAADNLRNVSMATGMSVEQLDSLQAAAAQADVPFDSLTTSLNRFAKNMVEAKNGNRDIAAAFKSLGVSITDTNGKLRPTGDVIGAISDRFSKLKDGPEKAALAIKLFGKSGAELIPLLNEGAKSLSAFSVGFTTDFSDRADNFNDTLVRLSGQLKGKAIDGLKVLLPTLQEIASAFENMRSGESLIGVFEGLGEVARVVAVALNSVAYVLFQVSDAFITTLKSASITAKNFADQITTTFSATGKQIWSSLKGDASGGAKQASDELKAFVDREKKALAERDKINDEYAKRSKTRAEAEKKFAQDVLKNSIFAAENENKTLAEIRARREAETKSKQRKSSTVAPDIAGLNGNEQLDKVEQFRQMQQLEIAQRKESIDDIGKNRAELAALTEVRKLDVEALRVSKGLNEEQKKRLAEVTAEIKQQRLELVQLEEERRRSFGAGAKEAFRDYVDAATNAANQVKNVFQGSLRSLEDSLVTFFKTGKADWTKFADEVLTLIIRMQVQALIASSIMGIGSLGSSLFGSSATAAQTTAFAGNPQLAGNTLALAKGGVVGPEGAVSLKRYAQGGVANYPQMAIFGEGARPEAYVPLPDGRTIPVTLEGKGGNSNVINVSVNMANGQTSVDTQAQTGKQLGSLIAVAVQQELIKQQRPGGLLA